MLCCRGVRGAITVDENSTQAILSATEELLRAIVATNKMEEQDVASVFFTVTPDLDAICPAVAARQMGWTRTALLCLQEMAVPGSLPRFFGQGVDTLDDENVRTAEQSHLYPPDIEG